MRDPDLSGQRPPWTNEQTDGRREGGRDGSVHSFDAQRANAAFEEGGKWDVSRFELYSK